jgi:hypothetical protein
MSYPAWNRIEISAERLENVRRLYLDEHLPVRDVAAAVGLSKTRTLDELRTQGWVRSSGATRRLRAANSDLYAHKPRDVERSLGWDPEIAWLWGLWFGDGWLSLCAGRPVVGFSGDYAALEQVRDLLGLHEHTIVDKKSKRLDAGKRLSVASYTLARHIEEAFGVRPGRKSRILRWPLLPSGMESHFIRGLWDSDGCWTASKGPVRKDGLRKHYLQGSYGSMSRSMVTAVRDCLVRLVGVTEKKIERQKKGLWVVRFSAVDSVLLGRWLYEGDCLRCSERKHMIWTEIQNSLVPPSQGYETRTRPRT